MKVIHQRKKCIGCGACNVICPKYWEITEDGLSKLKGGKTNPKTNNDELEVKTLGCNKEAAEACPVQIIKIAVILFGLMLANQALAVCPVCVIAVGGGVELSRWLGVDDTISGAWIGGLIVSVSLWAIIWLKKKNINFRWLSGLIFILFYAVTILSLYWMKMIGFPGCQKLWGYDKLLVGLIFGSLGFTVGHGLHIFLKKKNNNKVYFPFQKVVLPLILLIAASVVFHFITKCNPLQRFL